MIILCVLAFILIAFPLAAQAMEPEADQPLECPQCGLWQVTASEIPELVGEGIYIDAKAIVIPGCGTFKYTAKTSVEEPDGFRRSLYKIAMSLKQEEASYLCAQKDKDDWRLNLEVTGISVEGGRASFTLRRNETETPVIQYTNGWNEQREELCNTGSGYTSIACAGMPTAVMFKALAVEAERAYQYLIFEKSAKKLPTFSAERFSARVLEFCKKREHEAGGPAEVAYALFCQYDLLKAKYEEFKAWRGCMLQPILHPGKKHKPCKFPDERFDKAKKKKD